MPPAHEAREPPGSISAPPMETPQAQPHVLAPPRSIRRITRDVLARGQAALERVMALAGRSPRALAAGIFLCGLVMTSLPMWWVRALAQQDDHTRFDLHVSRLDAAIAGRFAAPLHGLMSLRGLYDATPQVDQAAFKRFVAAREMPTEFPGLIGFGFIERVRPAPTTTAATTTAETPAATTPAASSGPPDAASTYLVRHFEPAPPHANWRGQDLGQSEQFRQSIDHAIRSGQVVLTAPLSTQKSSSRIAQPGDARQPRSPDLALVMPLYARDAPLQTAAQRDQALVGLLYAPFVIEHMLADVISSADRQLDFELFDGQQANTRHLLFDLDGHLGPTEREVSAADFRSRALQTARHVSVGGRDLLLLISTTPAFHVHGSWSQVLGIGLAGLLSSALLATIVWLLGTGRQHAQATANRITADLRSANAKAEAALRDGQALLRTLHSYALISITNGEGDIIEVNDAFCEASGYDRDELIGQNHRLLNSGQQSPFFWVDMWQTIASGQSWRGEICNRAKDGSLYWVDSIITPFIGSDGRVEKYISIRNNITHIKAAQEELRRRDERQELALEGGNDGLWDWVDVHAQDEWWSPQFYRLLGYEPGEIESSLVAFDDMLHPDDRARTFQALEMALSEEHVFSDLLDNRRGFEIEYRLRTKSGQYRWFHARAKVFFDGLGEPTRMAGSIQDIHDRWVAQQQTQERSEQLDAIFSLSPDGFVSFDMAGRITYASPVALRLTGLTFDEVIGQPETVLIDRLRSNASNPSLLEGLSSLGSGDDVETGAARVIELTRPVRCTLELSVHRGDTSNAVSQVIHLRDVTFQTEVDQMKTEFLSTAAHELRTPMASIFGFTELLMSREMPPEKQKQLLGKIYRQSQVMITILNELLDLARIEARRGKDFVLEVTDLCELLRDVVRDFQPPNERALPEMVLPDEPQWAKIDRNKLLQALRNLLSNAYKYSPGGGAVHARIVHRQATDTHAAQIGLQIEDHGLGLTPEQLSRVCERFYRADKSGNIPGTGLGMSIVKEIIELLGGQMVLASEFGSGTTVTLWLPVAAAPIHTPGPQDARAEA